MNNQLPPLPPGFSLDAQGDHPPLPPGFTLDAQPQAPAPQQPVSTGMDMLKAVPAGLAETPASILNTLTHPSMIANMLLSPFLGSSAAQKTGGFLDAGAQATLPAANAAGHASSDLASYQPQSLPGQYIKTIASFAPAALGGEGGMLARAARVAVPAVTSETAGQLTKGTSAEPYARLIGGLVGGVGETLAEGSPKLPPPPATSDIKAQAQQLYDSANQAGVVVKNDALKNFSGDVSKTIADEGLSKRLHPGALGALQDIQEAADSGQPVTLKGLDLLRQNVGDVAATSTTPGERRLAGIMRDKMDDFMGNLAPSDVISGDPQQATQVLGQARDLWQTYKKSALIDDLTERAKNAAGANYTQAGYETALRRQFKSLADNPSKMRGFSPDEQDAILSIVRGGPLDNAMRSVGRFVTRGPVSGMATMGATAMGGPVAGAAMTGLTEGARYMATRGTMNNVENLQNLIRGQQPAPSAAQSLLSGPVLQHLLRSGALPTLLFAPQYQNAAQ